MNNINWNEVPDEVARPVPGGYVAKITHVEDDTQKEYLKIEWDFFEGEFKGANKESADAFGFWPMTFYRSYKQTALRFFKAFKTCVEVSNKGFVFQNDPKSLEGKFIGVVLGEEEYVNKKGAIRTRLYVSEVRGARAIKDGDFSVPDFKKLSLQNASATQNANTFTAITDDDDELPF